MTKIAVIIPAYNEELTISDVLKCFHQENPDYFYCVIDNNSKDKTYQLAMKAIQEFGIQGIILQESKQGKSNAVRKAFRHLDFDYYVMVDADLTYSPKDLKHLVNAAIEKRMDMIVGDRIVSGDYHKENKRPFHSFGNRLVVKMINLLFNSKINDAMSGYRVFSHAFVKSFPILTEGFELETEMTLHALDKRLSFMEIPIEYKDRPAGSFSKLNTYKDGLRVIRTIFRIFKNYRPLQFFGILGLIAMIMGAIVGYPVIMEFIEFRYVYKVPSAILATGLVLIGFISSAIGIILDTLLHFHHAQFELDVINKSKIVQ
jgi:glycosyltransferase involved in cell wall biosynthesis